MKRLKPHHVIWLICIAGFIALFSIPALRPAYLADGPRTVVEATLEKDSTSQKVAGSSVGGPFQLIDQDGRQVTEKSWPGQYLLLYFGFTHCPDVCPLGLNRLTEALNKLPPEQVAHIQPVLITVDPERDTPAELKTYVALFHPKLVGLTGTVQQIEEIKKNYRVYAEKQGNDKDYMVNHSAFTYLMAPSGELDSVFSHDTTVDEMALKLSERVQQSTR